MSEHALSELIAVAVVVAVALLAMLFWAQLFGVW